MTPEQISLNIYTLRARLKTPAAVAEAMKRLSEIGFRSIQANAWEDDSMDEAEFLRICADNGITITAMHEPFAVLKEPQKSIDRLGRFGVTQTAYAYPVGIDFSDEAAIEAWIERLEEVNQIFRKAGITFSYHNHEMEFMKFSGRTVMERIFSDTTLNAEIDTYWTLQGGGWPLEWVRRFAEVGRLPLLHVKDRRIAYDATARYFMWFTEEFAELGEGIIDFPPIIAAAEAGGCQSFIIEQDGCFMRDELDSVAISYRYLRENFVR